MVAQAETADIHVLTVPTPGPRRIIKPPADDEFDGDFLPARALEVLGEQVRVKHGMPTEITVAYVWKRKGGKGQGKIKLAYCNKVSGLAKFYSAVDFVIWVAADHCRELELTQDQYEALLHHELQHAGIDPDSLEPIVVGHDFEGFRANIELYGLWLDELQRARDSFEQARMFA